MNDLYVAPQALLLRHDGDRAATGAGIVRVHRDRDAESARGIEIPAPRGCAYRPRGARGSAPPREPQRDETVVRQRAPVAMEPRDIAGIYRFVGRLTLRSAIRKARTN